MKHKDILVNKHVYNIFSICEDFRQRLEQLTRLKEKGLSEERKDENEEVI